VDEDFLKEIGAPFSQGRSPSLSGGEGTGLGLAITIELLARQGGDFRIENRPEGGARAVARLPLLELLRHHAMPLLLGSGAMVVCYALFYIATVFALSYGTATLGIPRPQFLLMLCAAVVCMALVTPPAAAAGDRFGRRPVLIAAALGALLSGFALAPLLGSGDPVRITLYLCLSLTLMGLSFAPMGALLPELFPPQVRYSGAGTAYQLGGILGAALALHVVL
jgi:MFS family permease